MIVSTRNRQISRYRWFESLPDGYTARTTRSQIHLASSGRFLYVANRGHNSIAGFAVDGTGRMTAIGHASTEPVPSTFCLNPEGHFVFAAGTESGRLASYRINGETGALTPLATYAVDGGRWEFWQHVLVSSGSLARGSGFVKYGGEIVGFALWRRPRCGGALPRAVRRNAKPGRRGNQNGDGWRVRDSCSVPEE